MFIGKVNSLMQEFHFASPQVLMKLLNSYACNIYGSNTWDLFSQDCKRLCNSYNVAVRNIFGLPRQTHRYLLECVSDTTHLYVQLLSRYVTFCKSLLSNDAFQVRFLARLSVHDMRTTLGKTMANIAILCNTGDNIYELCANTVKKVYANTRKRIVETWNSYGNEESYKQ